MQIPFSPLGPAHFNTWSLTVVQYLENLSGPEPPPSVRWQPEGVQIPCWPLGPAHFHTWSLTLVQYLGYLLGSGGAEGGPCGGQTHAASLSGGAEDGPACAFEPSDGAVLLIGGVSLGDGVLAGGGVP